MGLWLKVHREVTGAWRSACYDVYRQVSRRKLAQLLTQETAEFAPRHRAPDAPRRPRRVAATSGVALLVAGGAAGTYLAVAGSLTALRTPPPPAPVAAAGGPEVTGADVTEGAPAQPQPTHARPQVRRSAPPPVLAMPAVPPSAGQPTTNTPESTPTPSASPSPSASASASPSASVPSPTRTASKTPKQGQSSVGMAGR